MGHRVENLHDIKLSHPCNKNWNETFNIFFHNIIHKHFLQRILSRTLVQQRSKVNKNPYLSVVMFDVLCDTHEVLQLSNEFSSSVTFGVEWKVKGKKYENMNEENT